MSGLVFLGCLLSSFGFFADVVVFFVFPFFFFKRDSSGSNRAHPHTHLVFFSFSCLCPRRIRVYLPFWPCVLSFWRFVGVPFWAPGVFGDSLDSLGTLLRPFFSDARRQGCFIASRAWVVFPLFVLFCGCTPFLEARVGFLAEVGSPSRLFQPKWAERAIEPAPRESDPQGSASCAEGWSPPFPGFWRLILAAIGSQGPLGPFYLGRGRFICPLRPFFTRTCRLFPAPGFFFSFFLSRWPSGPRMECLTLLAAMQNSERCSENTPELSECHSERHALRDPHPSPANFGRIRGKCCAFFYGAVFREIPLIVLAFFFFTVLLLLVFLSDSFLGRTLAQEWGGGSPGFL